MLRRNPSRRHHRSPASASSRRGRIPDKQPPQYDDTTARFAAECQSFLRPSSMPCLCAPDSELCPVGLITGLVAGSSPPGPSTHSYANQDFPWFDEYPRFCGGAGLEAHSGLGNGLDDPRYVGEKGRGPTPLQLPLQSRRGRRTPSPIRRAGTVSQSGYKLGRFPAPGEPQRMRFSEGTGRDTFNFPDSDIFLPCSRNPGIKPGDDC